MWIWIAIGYRILYSDCIWESGSNWAIEMGEKYMIQYCMNELVYTAHEPQGSYVTADLTAEFISPSGVKQTVKGFYDGNTTVRVLNFSGILRNALKNLMGWEYSVTLFYSTHTTDGALLTCQIQRLICILIML